MKIKIKTLVIIVFFIASFSLNAQALFEVKDASDHSVFEIANDGIRIFNYPDTIMVISSSEIRANLDNSKNKALSRSFSVTTATSSKGALANVLEVTTNSTSMREGVAGDRYTDFSPENMFLGLNAGRITTPDGTYGEDNMFIGNEAGYSHTTGNDNIFIGKSSGYITNYGSNNIFMGHNAGYNNKTGGDNIYIGKEAGFGYQSGSVYSNGQANIAIGVNSGHTIQTGGDNIFAGYWTGYNTTDGDKNIFIGNLSGYTNTVENNNVYVGYATGAFNAGEKNVILGSGDDAHMPPSNRAINGSVFLGFAAGTLETNSNRLYIENSYISDPLIYGEFDNDILAFNTTKTYVKHPVGISNGLYIQNTYDGNTDVWNFYQYSTDELALFFNGSKRGDWDTVSGAYTSISDKRFKKNVEEFTNILDKVMLLQPKKYNFRTQNNNDSKYVGLIAQDVEKLFPSFVHYNKEDDTYSLDYAGLSVVAIQAIKEQQDRIDELESRLSKLSVLKKDIEEIKKLLNK